MLKFTPKHIFFYFVLAITFSLMYIFLYDPETGQFGSDPKGIVASCNLVITLFVPVVALKLNYSVLGWWVLAMCLYIPFGWGGGFVSILLSIVLLLRKRRDEP